MEAQEFLRQIDSDAIVNAIRDAEQKSTGRICVFISRKKPKDALRTAERRFVRMRMNDSPARNTVLIYLAPRAQKLACIGDRAFDQSCGEIFWREVTREVSEYFRKGEFTQGVLHGIRKAGAVFAEHFPAGAAVPR
jgi:uncharacterized membrane protein